MCPVPDKIAPTLKDLIDKVRGGGELDLSGKADPDRAVSADWIRKILLATCQDKPYKGLVCDPRGIRIRGASIPDDLNLDGVSTKIGLRLTDCTMAGSLTACDASLPWLELTRCELRAVTADRAQVGNLTIQGGAVTGQLRLAGARVSGALTVCAVAITSESGPALMADGLKVGDGDVGNAVMDRLEATGGTSSEGAVSLTEAKVSGNLSLRGATLRNAAGPALTADGLSVQDVLMAGDADGRQFSATGAGEQGTIRLTRAAITGQLSLEGATVVTGPPGAAAQAAGGSSRGAVCLSSAVIGGNLVLRRATLTGGSGPALLGEGLIVKGHAGFCDSPGQRLEATSSSDRGTIYLPGAAITGQLSLRGAVLSNDQGPALMAELATIQEDVILDQGFAATAAGPAASRGAVRLTEAKVSGNLSLRGATLRNAAGPALTADGLSVQDVLMAGDADGLQFSATGAGEQGTIRLTRAAITGQLSLEGATVVTDPPGAGAPAAGSPSVGAVCLSGAVIGSHLILRRATLISAADAALMADYLTVKGDAGQCERPGDGLLAIGPGELGAVCFAGAAVTGQLSLCGSTLVNLSGPAFVAAFALIGGDAFLAENFTALSSGASVYLADATFGKELVCSGVFVGTDTQAAAGARGLALDFTRAKIGTLRLGSGFRNGVLTGFTISGRMEFAGFTYTGLPVLGDEQSRPRQQSKGVHWPALWPDIEKAKVDLWIGWFRDSLWYSAQPYQSLAAAYEGAGYDSLARHIMVRQCDDARSRGSLTPVRGAAQFCSRWLIGYGYHCVAALAWLAGLFIATAAIAVIWFGPAQFIVSTATAPAPAPAAATYTQARSCPVTGDLGYAIAVAFPVIDISAEQQCDVPAQNARWGVVVFGWVVRIMAALLAGVYVLGISGLNRSTPSGSGT